MSRPILSKICDCFSQFAVHKFSANVVEKCIQVVDKVSSFSCHFNLATNFAISRNRVKWQCHKVSFEESEQLLHLAKVVLPTWSLSQLWSKSLSDWWDWKEPQAYQWLANQNSKYQLDSKLQKWSNELIPNFSKRQFQNNLKSHFEPWWRPCKWESQKA